jgi:3-deoxy-7-phosphoheptulonate synthase
MGRPATPKQIQFVVDEVQRLGAQAHVIPGDSRTSIGVTGHQGRIEKDFLKQLPGVSTIIPITRPYKLVSRETRQQRTAIHIDDVVIGGDEVVVMAGPCSIESSEQAMTIAHSVHQAGAKLFRGGAFKPRTSPYSFQGMGEPGLKIMSDVKRETGLVTITEAIDKESCDLVAKYCDVIQIGARNMQNFSLLTHAGRSGKPVMLKRGLAATIEEWLMAAEYILKEGNHQVMLCERGVRTFAQHTRNTLDLSAVPTVRWISHLPIIVDPSHGTGRREKVTPLSRAAVAVGADGIIVEVHHKPEEALSDGDQSLLPDQFDQLMWELGIIVQALGRKIEGPADGHELRRVSGMGGMVSI